MTLRKTRSIAFGVGNGGTWTETAGAGVETYTWDLVNKRVEIDANDASALRYLLTYSESGYTTIRNVRVEAAFQRVEYPKRWPIVGLFARLQETGECYALVLRAIDSDQEVWAEIRKGIWSEIAHGGGNLLTPHDASHHLYLGDDAAWRLAIQVFNQSGQVVISYYVEDVTGVGVLDTSIIHRSHSLLTAGGGAGIIVGAADGTPNGVDATTKLYVDDFKLFGHDRTITDPLPGDAPVTLIEVTRKTQGTLYLSCGPEVNAPAASYHARVAGAGVLARGYSADLEMPSFSLDIGDADAALRASIGALEFENQTVTVKVGLLDEENVISYETLFTGRVVGAGSCDEERVTLEVEQDEPFGRVVINDGSSSLQLPVIDENSFSENDRYDLDADSVGKTIPVLFGDHYKIGGAIEGVYVGLYEDESGNKYYEWVIAAFHKDAVTGSVPLYVTDVWIKNKEDDNWRLLFDHADVGTAAFRNYGSVRIASWRASNEGYVIVDADTEVRFNVTQPATLPHRPVEIIDALLQYYSERVSGSAGLAKRDTANFNTFDNLCEQWGIAAAGIIDDGKKTVCEVIGELCRSLDIRPSWTGAGKLKLHWFTPTADANSADDADFYNNVRLVGEHETEGFRVAYAPQEEGLFGNLTDVSWPEGEDTRDVYDSTSRAARARTLAAELEFPWLNDPVRAFAAALRYLTTRQNPRLLAEYSSDGRAWGEGIGDTVRLTHYYGPAAGGWTGRPLEIWRQEYDPQTHRVTMRAADVPAVFNNDGAFCANFATLGLTNTGTVQVSAGSGLVDGAGTQFSLAQAGDCLRVYDGTNAANNVVARVTAVYNNSQLRVNYSSWTSASGLSFELVKGISRASTDERTRYLYLCDNTTGEHEYAVAGTGKKFW